MNEINVEVMHSNWIIEVNLSTNSAKRTEALNILQNVETYPKYWKPGLNMDQVILRNLSYFYLVKLGRKSGN